MKDISKAALAGYILMILGGTSLTVTSTIFLMPMLVAYLHPSVQYYVLPQWYQNQMALMILKHELEASGLLVLGIMASVAGVFLARRA